MSGLHALLLLVLGLAGVHGSSYPTEVVELTDTNFEHDTQAASGQTTGVWAVLFTDSTVRRHERATLALEELASDDEKELIYAKVDVAQSIKLAKRFGALIFPPSILLFRDRQMYVFDRPFDRDDIVAQVREFVTTGYASTTPMAVPERLERQINMEAFDQGTKVDMRVVGIAVLTIVGGLLFQTWALLNKDKFRPEPEAAGGPAAEASAPDGEDRAAAAAGKAQGTKARPGQQRAAGGRS